MKSELESEGVYTASTEARKLCEEIELIIGPEKESGQSEKLSLPDEKIDRIRTMIAGFEELLVNRFKLPSSDPDTPFGKLRKLLNTPIQKHESPLQGDEGGALNWNKDFFRERFHTLYFGMIKNQLAEL